MVAVVLIAMVSDPLLDDLVNSFECGRVAGKAASHTPPRPPAYLENSPLQQWWLDGFHDGRSGSDVKEDGRLLTCNLHETCTSNISFDLFFPFIW